MKEISPERKRKMLIAAGIGTVIGIALSGVIWFTLGNAFFAVAIIPLAAVIGGAQYYLMP